MPHAIILYHYFHPDDVISARHFSDLAEGLADRGFQVTAIPCHRGCRDESQTYPRSEVWGNIEIQRIWRPRFRQASNLGRIGNAAWMLAQWSWVALTHPRHRDEIVIVGTDPILSVLTAIPFRLFRTRTRVAHWCFDLYPEAAIADGLMREKSVPARGLKFLLALAYRCCGAIVDLGSCMRELLAKYGSKAKVETITPWSLVEPKSVVEPDSQVRESLFGNDATLGLLYSGNFGRAHDYVDFLALARKLRGSGVKFCFAGRGNRADELRKAVTAEDTNIRFAGFAPEAELEKRLTACDLHLVSLRPEWTGTVVPSKFFGALASGRGVIYVGSPNSAIAKWIEEFQVGWVLVPENLEKIVEEIRNLSLHPEEQSSLRMRCFQAYHNHFCKALMIDLWDRTSRRLIS